MRSNAREAVEARRHAWRQRLEQELNRMVQILRQRADVEAVLVFGSMATGQPRYRSDLDLVIVQRTTKRFLDRLSEWYGTLSPRVQTDILVYTPEEWSDLKATRAFVRRIAREGKVLYEAERNPRSSSLA